MIAQAGASGSSGSSNRRLTRQGLPAGFIWELPEHTALTLLETAQLVTYAPGSLISGPGSTARPGLLAAGRVRVYVQRRDGRQAVIAYLEPGEAIGFLRFFAPTLEVTVQALSAAEVIQFWRPALDQLLETDGEFATAVMRHLAGRVETSYRDRFAHVFGGARQRIAQHLLDLAQPVDGQLVALVTQQQLADAAGIVREHASRIIRELRRGRMVTTSRGALTILDPPALRRLARDA
jgi:CRP/FNR family transcriptional regulator